LLDLSDGNNQGQPGTTEIHNTFTGSVTINAGTILVNDDQNFGAIPGSFNAAAIVLNGGTILTTRGFNFSINRGITVGPQGGTLAYEGGGTWGIAQKITGPGGVTFSSVPVGYTAGGAAGNPANTVNLSSPLNNNTYQGPTVLNAQVNTSATGTLAANLVWTIAEQIPDSSAVTLTGNAGTGGVNFANFAETIGSLSSAAGVGVIKNLGVFTTGFNNLSTSYGGTIAGNGSFTKVGSGTQILAGTTSYTGVTNIGTNATVNTDGTGFDGGTLLVTGTMTGTSQVNVGTTTHTGILGGSGTINAPVVVNALGQLAPAVTPTSTSTLTIGGNLTINAGATFTFNFGASGLSDLIDITGIGNVTLNAGTDILNISQLGGFGAGTYNLISVLGTGTLVNNATFTIKGATNFNYAVGVSGNNLVLTVTPGFATYAWSGSTNGAWDTATSNWTSAGAGNVFQAGSNVIFDDTALGNTTITVPSAVNANSLTFQNSNLNYTIGGAPITVTTTIEKDQAGNATLTGTVGTSLTTVTAGKLIVGSGGSFTSTTSAVVTGGTLDVEGTLTTPQLTVGAAGALTVGSGGRLANTTSLALAGTATFANPTQTLLSISGAGNLVLNGTAFTFPDGTSFGGSITGSGSVAVSGGSSVTLSGANGFTGGGVINNGLLTLTNANSTMSGIIDVQPGGGLFASPGSLGAATVKLSSGSLSLVGGTGITSALSGAYYNNAPTNTANANPNFANFATITSHFANLIPTLVAPTNTSGKLSLDWDNTNGTTSAAIFTDQGFTQVTQFEVFQTGKIDITVPGLYTFATASDDGSMLFIDGNTVVDNNLFHAYTTKTGTVFLGVGLHDIAIGYYQGTGNDGFSASYTVPGGASTFLPNSVFLSGTLGTQAYGNNVLATVSSTIDVPNAALASLGNLTMSADTALTFPHGGVSFTSSTFTGGAYTFLPAMAWADIHPGRVIASGNVTLVNNGPGNFVFDYTAGPNFASGTNNITSNGGIVAVVGQHGGSDPLGNASVTLNAGSLGLVLSSVGGSPGDVTFDNAVAVSASTGIYAQRYGSGVLSGGNMTLGGANGVSVTGGATLTLGAFDGYTLTLAGSLLSDGNVTSIAGNVNLNGTANIAGNLNVQAGTVGIGATTGYVTATNVQVGTGTGVTATANVNGTLITPNLTVASNGVLNVSSTGALDPVNSSTNLTVTGQASFANASQTLASLSGPATGVVTLTGAALTLTNSAIYNGQINGTGSLTVNALIGSTVTLSNGASNYSGGTTITAGTLAVTNPTGSATGTGPVNVQTNGFLSGTGSIAGAVTLAGVLAPGANPTSGLVGTLTLNNGLTINNGATFAFDFGNTVNSDSTSVTGAIAFPASGSEVLNLNAMPGFGLGTYILATASTGITGTPNINIFSGGSGLPTYPLLLSISVVNAGTVNNPNAQQLVLTVDATSIKWSGQNNNLWDISASANWQDSTGTATTYSDPNAYKVVFADTDAKGNPVQNSNINIASTVTPISTVFNNLSVPYTVGGADISGTGNLVVQGGGSVTLTGANTYTGSTIVTNGVLNISADNNLGAVPGTATPGAIQLNGGTLVTTGSFAISPTRGMAVGSTGGTLNIGAGLVSYAGTIGNIGTQAGSLTKSGNGELDLGGANTFSGGLKVNAGAVKLLVAGAGGTGAITVNTGGVVSAGGATSSPITLAGGTIGVTGAQTFSGNFTVANGTTSTIDSFDPVTGLTSADFILTGSLNGSGNINFGTVNGNTPDTNGLRLRGTGASTFSGTITVPPSGKFEIQSAVAGPFSPAGTGMIVLTGGTIGTAAAGTFALFNIRDNFTANTVFGNNIRLAGTGTVLFNPIGTAPANSTFGLGSLTIGDGQIAAVGTTAGKTQNLVFTGVNLTGSTSSATLQPGIPGNTNYVQAQNITVTGGVQEVTPGGGAGFTVNGTSNLTLNGASSYSGATNVTAGNLIVNGSISGSTAINVSGAGVLSSGSNTTASVPNVILTGNAILSPGTTVAGGATLASIGALNVAGNLNLGDIVSNTHLQIELGGLTAGTQYDQIITSGAGTSINLTAVNLDGSFVNNFGATQVPIGDLFFIVINGGGSAVNGAFINATPDPLNGNPSVTIGTQVFDISYTASAVGNSFTGGNDIALMAVPEPGALTALIGGFGMLAGLQRFRSRPHR